MKTALLLLVFLLQCACSGGSEQHRTDAQTAALKTCNEYLKPRMNAKSIDIPSGDVAFSVQGDALVVRWPFNDGESEKIGRCTTSSNGKTFRFAEALPANT
jgi:hypothetical protein